MTIFELEGLLESEFRKHTCLDVLLAIRMHCNDEPSFLRAGVAMRAIKSCKKAYQATAIVPVSPQRIQYLSEITMHFQLSDPITHESEPDALRTVLRTFASQSIFESSLRDFGRAWLIWQELPIEMRQHGDDKFDFPAAFRKVCGLSPAPFLRLLYTAWAGSSNNAIITRGYFAKAISDGIAIPESQEVATVLRHVSGTPADLRCLATAFQCADRRYAAYDFNPLLVKPIVRPWPRARNVDSDLLLAPVPDLISYRACTGTYYALFNEYQEEFSRFFGYLFEQYVGRILGAFVDIQEVVSEEHVRKCLEPGLPVIDWYCRVGNSVVILECKATRHSRSAVTVGESNDIKKSLKQVQKATQQLTRVLQHMQLSSTSYSFMAGVTKIIPVIVTWELVHLVNSTLMRDAYLPDTRDITVLSVQELEYLQMLSAKGISIVASLDVLVTHGTSVGMQMLAERAHAVNGDSVLMKSTQLLVESMHA